ncbi:MAG: long-chain fatty acid--CoA ligase [Sphingomonadales bacterium]
MTGSGGAVRPTDERPWLKSYPKEVTWDQTFEASPLGSLIDEAAAEYPDLNHIDFLGRKFTYRETLDLASRGAKGFQQLGLKPGARVGIFMPNCPQYVYLFFAILKAGGTVVNLSPLYSRTELEHQIADSGVEIIVTINLKWVFSKIEPLISDGLVKKVVFCRLEDGLGTGKGLAFRLFKGRHRARMPDHPAYSSEQTLLANDGAFEPVDIEPHTDIAVLQYTGGTTGLPKGAMLSHANITINLRQALAWEYQLQTGTARFLAVLPLFHAYAMTIILCGCTALAGEIILLLKFEAGEALNTIRRTRPDFLPTVPTILTAFLSEPGFRADDLSSVTACLSGGAPLAEDLRSRVNAVLADTAVREGYGLTETSPIAIAEPASGLSKPGTVGLPVPGTEVFITDPEDPAKALGTGEIGEICLAGPQIMQGYWQHPKETAQAIGLGWLRTGDLGYLDEDGFLFVVDRIKDMIIVGGLNVYPRIIEEAIFEHPEVVSAAVIGLADDYLGEAPVAFVVRNEGSELDEPGLLAFLADRIGKHEMPRSVTFRTSLPETMVGKVDKKALVAELDAKAAKFPK